MQMPLILFWKFEHFVVLEGIKNDRYYVNDPAIGHCVIDKYEFDRSYTGIALSFEVCDSFQSGKPEPGIIRQFWPWLSDVRPALYFALICGLLLVIPGLSIRFLFRFCRLHFSGKESWGSTLVLLMFLVSISSYLLT